MAAQVLDYVQGRYLGTKEVHLPAPQPQDLGQQPGRQRVPLAVHAGHSHSACRDDGLADRVVSQDSDDTVADGGGGMFLGDIDPVARPLEADLALHRGDHLEQNVLGCPADVQHRKDGSRCRMFVAINDRRP